MKKTFKKLMAFAMVAVMMANPMAALAAETTEVASPEAAKGSADASGNVEGFVDTSVFKVVLPTDAEGTFDFVMDPQGLIAATSGEAYTGATFASGNVFFQTTSGNYTDQSAFIEVLNKGTVAVNVSVEATVTGLGDVKAVANKSAFSTGSAAVPELYLAFVASGNVVENGPVVGAAVATNTTTKVTSAKVTATLPAASDDCYEYTYASGEYSFNLKDEYADDGAETFSNYSFALTGACNSEADWTDVKSVAPAVKVVWTLEDAESGNPDINATKTASSTAAISVEAVAPVTSATWVALNGGAKEGTLTNGTHYAVNGNRFAVTTALAKAITSGTTTITLHFADGSTQNLNITVQ